jgi:formylglycine-generating enzyme required for sulfatase activity/Rieske Fe-S protein
MSPSNDETMWYYPDSLHLGQLDFDTDYEFILRVAVPAPSRLTSQVSGLLVDPEHLAPGTNEIILRVESLERDTLLNGTLWLCTTSQERKIAVTGHVMRVPDGKPKKPRRVLAWEPAEWEILNSGLIDLPLPPSEPISPDPLPPISLNPSPGPVKPPPGPVKTPRSRIKVGAVESITSEFVDDRWKGAERFYLVRSKQFNGQDIIYALRSVCPDRGCTPEWVPKARKFKCPFHGKGFAISGLNEDGPHARSLERLKVALERDGQIVVDATQIFRYELGQWTDPESFVVAPGVALPRPKKRGLTITVPIALGCIGLLAAAFLWNDGSNEKKGKDRDQLPKPVTEIEAGLGAANAPVQPEGPTEAEKNAGLPGPIGVTKVVVEKSVPETVESKPNITPPRLTDPMPASSVDTTSSPANAGFTPRLPDPTLANSVGMQLVLIRPGRFETTWGGARGEGPRRTIKITHAFYLGDSEVTQDQWRERMFDKPSPSFFSPEASGSGREAVAGMDTKRNPVEQVTWFDAVDYCISLSRKEGFEPYYERKGRNVRILGGTGYRLPTEAEWEYACRGRSGSGPIYKFSFGDDKSRLGDYAWYSGNALGKNDWEITHPIRGLQKNSFELFDMHGNVSEWCWDWYSTELQERQDIVEDPQGPPSGERRVIRGGCFKSDDEHSGCAERASLLPDHHSNDVGFRVARSVSK